MNECVRHMLQTAESLPSEGARDVARFFVMRILHASNVGVISQQLLEEKGPAFVDALVEVIRAQRLTEPLRLLELGNNKAAVDLFLKIAGLDDSCFDLAWYGLKHFETLLALAAGLVELWPEVDSSEVNLEALDALMARTTPGEWEYESRRDNCDEYYTLLHGACTFDELNSHDAEAIVALHNAYPYLRALIVKLERELLKVRQELASRG